MAVTPNFNWPIPTATDYVKDGYDAIADLGNAIDTTVAGLGSGLNQVVPTSIVKGASGTASVSTGGAVTFSGTESVSLNGCFSSTYRNYALLINWSSVSVNDTEFRLRFRTSGTDNSNNSYVRGGIEIGVLNSAALSGFTNLTNTNVGLGFAKSTQGLAVKAELFSPFETDYTKIMSDSVGYSLQPTACVFNATTSFDGFTVYPASGTITGTIRVYGYQNG